MVARRGRFGLSATRAPTPARWLLGFGLLAPRAGPAVEPAPAPTPAEPTFWAEREGERLRVTVDLRLREHDGGKVRGRLRSALPARWDLWAEEMRCEDGRPGKAERAFSTRGHPFPADRLPTFKSAPR